MAIKYIPFVPDTLNGQAILDNFQRTRRVQTLRYNGNDEPAKHILRGMPLYETDLKERSGHNDGGNLIIRGECLSACAYLKDQGRQVDLVYIDPPFASGADYAKKVYLRRNPLVAKAVREAETKLSLDSVRAFEEKMYGDIWDKEKYLNWMYENLMAIKAVMSDTASIYVHLDWHIGHYVKILLDEIFGEANFRNEIVWHYYNKMQGNVNRFASDHDVIFVYSMSDSYTFHAVKEKREESVRQIKRVWDKQKQKLVNAKDEHGHVQYIETDEKTVDDVWRIPMLQPADKTEVVDYATQKPEALIERIIEAASDKGMVVADFFGGSGVTATVANRLGRRFVHTDININSVQTTRDRLRSLRAEFDVLEVKDGIALYRNPAQTMDKLKKLIGGLRPNKKLGNLWAGQLDDSRRGMVPVYLPNLQDSSSRLLDKALMMAILNEIPHLPSEVRCVMVYYIDVDNERELRQFIREQGDPTVEVILRDLKQVLDNVVEEDQAEWAISSSGDGLFKDYTIKLTLFHSDRVRQAVRMFNMKSMLQPVKGRKFKPIRISTEGLETVEWVSIDCYSERKDAEWHSDSEIKIDPLGYVIKDGVRTHDLWDGTISCNQEPLRMKIRNICGDETVFVL